MTRAFKRSVCRVLIGVLLFAQFAVAAHACQNLARSAQGTRGAEAVMALDSNGSSPSAADAVPANPDQVAPSPCDDMAAPQGAIPANVCIEHCHFGQQTFDPGQLPSLSPAFFAVLYVLPTSIPADSARLMPAEVRAVPVAASPPHTILHCCFRI